MLITNDLDNLPDDFPKPVRETVSECVRLERISHEHLDWGRTPAFLLVLWNTPNGVRGDINELTSDLADGAYETADLVRDIVRNRRPVNTTGHPFAGVALLTEAILLKDDVENPVATTPEEMAEKIKDLVAVGQALQQRTVLAHHVTGWKIEVQRVRGSAPTLSLLGPDEPWEKPQPLHVMLSDACAAWRTPTSRSRRGRQDRKR